MKIQKESCYLAPEGEATGVITSVTHNVDEKNGKMRESLRITMRLDDQFCPPDKEYRARIDYWESQANDFLRDAKALIGEQSQELVNADGEFIIAKLNLLQGVRVRFRIIHDHKDGYADAYRRVVNLRPDQSPPRTGFRISRAA